MSELNVIVKPAIQIPKEASDIHGITNDVAERFGISPSVALECFLELHEKADMVVAHNIAFDARVLQAFECRYRGYTLSLKPRFCTMNATTSLCRIPSKYGFKWPKLQEAYKWAFGKEFHGAHNAMADVRACGRLFRFLRENYPEETCPDAA